VADVAERLIPQAHAAFDDGPGAAARDSKGGR
jgi:hypothetical protein